MDLKKLPRMNYAWELDGRYEISLDYNHGFYLEIKDKKESQSFVFKPKTTKTRTSNYLIHFRWYVLQRLFWKGYFGIPVHSFYPRFLKKWLNDTGKSVEVANKEYSVIVPSVRL